MDYDHPTAADYAWHNANEAQQQARTLARRVADLEKRVERLEAVIQNNQTGER